MEKREGNSFLFLIIIVGALVLTAAITLIWDPTTQELPPIFTPTYMAIRTLLPTSEVFPTVSPTPTTAYRPVTWMELVSFIEDDHTNWNKYIPDQYVCLDFAVDLVENARKQNIKAWIVSVDFTDGSPGHSFTAFETTDKGVVFIEPQADTHYVNPKVGQPLCDAWYGTLCMGTISSIEYYQCEHTHYCTPYSP
jgi:hypothetical protein